MKKLQQIGKFLSNKLFREVSVFNADSDEVGSKVLRIRSPVGYEHGLLVFGPIVAYLEDCPMRQAWLMVSPVWVWWITTNKTHEWCRDEGYSWRPR